MRKNLRSATTTLAERLGYLKLNDSLLTCSPLSRLLELEGLAAAAQERTSHWGTLDVVGRGDGRLDEMTFSSLRDEAEFQLQELNTSRRFAAVEALSQ